MNKSRISKRISTIAVIAWLFLSFIASLNGWQINLAYGTTIFSDGFDTGDFTAWTGTAASTATITAVTSPVHHGTHSANITGISADFQYAVAYEDVTAVSDVYGRCYVLIDSAPTGNDQWLYVGIDLKNQANNKVMGRAVFGKSAAGALQVGVYTEGKALADAVADFSWAVDTWYLVEVRAKRGASNGFAELWIDGTLKVNSTGLGADLDVTRVYVGAGYWTVHGGTGWATTLTIDCASFADAYIGADSPQVIATDTDTTMAGASCTFAAQFTPPSGTNLSYFIFGTNNTGSWVNETASAFSGSGAQWGNTTKTLSSTIGDVVQWQVWANDTSNAWGTTGLLSLTTTASYPQWYDLMTLGHKAGAETQFCVYWSISSPATLDYSVCSTNNTGSMVNTTVSVGASSGWHNHTITLNAVVGTTVQFLFYANSSTGLWNMTATYVFVTAETSMSLRTVGKYIKNDLDETVVMHGTNIRDFCATEVNGTWFNTGYVSLMGNWNITLIHENIDAMAVWGLNLVRVHFCAEYWIANTSGYVSHFQEMASLLRDHGMYLCLDLYCVNHTSGQRDLPYWNFAHEKDYGIINSSLAFQNFWMGVVQNMSSYENVMYEWFNEPNAEVTGDWEVALQSWLGTTALSSLGVAENVTIAARDYTDQCVLIQWSYCTIKTNTCVFFARINFTRAYNILYSTHLYRDGYSSWWNSDLNTLHAEMQNNILNWSENMHKPVFIGEIGLNYDASPLADEELWFSNICTILANYSVSTVMWGWHHYGGYRVFNYTQGSSLAKWGWIPETYEVAFWFINSYKETPFVWTVGNGTLRGYNYLYSNNTAWSSSWNSTGSALTISYTGSCEVRIYWNVSDTLYPVNSSLTCSHSNGTVVDALDFYDPNTNLIKLPSAAGSIWVIGYGVSAPSEVDLTVTSPTATTYTSGTITVTMSAVGGTVDKIWYNVKNGTEWVYVSNQTYTSSTTKSGFVNGAYLFYGYANNTDGDVDEKTVNFIVSISTSIDGGTVTKFKLELYVKSDNGTACNNAYVKVIKDGTTTFNDGYTDESGYIKFSLSKGYYHIYVKVGDIEVEDAVNLTKSLVKNIIMSASSEKSFLEENVWLIVGAFVIVVTSLAAFYAVTSMKMRPRYGRR